MPYINQNKDFIALQEAANQAHPKNSGELNFVITTICKNYFYLAGGRYQQINDIVGALEGSKLEFYRRLASKYEDTKIKENGDVY